MGLPDKPLTEARAFYFASNKAFLRGHILENREEMLKVLELAAKRGSRAGLGGSRFWKEEFHPVADKLKENRVRERFTLTEFD